MELFKCVECGHLFEIGEQKTWVEPHGESMSGCPICGGSYEEAVACKICDTYEDVEKNLCKECRERLKNELKEVFGKYENARDEIIEILEEIL